MAGYNSIMTVDTDEIPKSYSDAVRLLTQWQGESSPEGSKIFWFPDPQKHTVRLVVVSGDFLASGSVWTLPLGESNDFPFRSEVALLTPDEWRKVEKHKMPLPKGWRFSSRRQVWP
jgi:hypothetical protein